MKAVNGGLHHQKNCSYMILNCLPRIVKITGRSHRAFCLYVYRYCRVKLQIKTRRLS